MKAKLVAVGIGVIGLLVAIYLIWPEWFMLCETHDRGDGVMVCSSPYWNPYGTSLLRLSLAFVALSSIAIFVTRKTFWRWLKFSVVYGIIITILLITIPSVGAGTGGFGFTLIDTKGFATLYAVLYVIISVPLLGISEFLTRRKA